MGAQCTARNPQHHELVMVSLATTLMLCEARRLMMINRLPLSRCSLRDVTVRPVWGMTEPRVWDRLVATHHSLGFHGTFGRA